MQQMVSSALGLTEVPEPADAADALAVALCHAHLARAQERIDAAMSPTPVVVASRSAIRNAQAPRNRIRAARILES
jgi:crossover junction endodeoxyribonuclease RuvC